jgi:SAM-dependent methyltransferase
MRAERGAERAIILAAVGGLAAVVALRLGSPERYAALMRRLGLAAPTNDDLARDIVRKAYAATAKGSQSCCVVPSSAKVSSLSYSAAERAVGEATGSDLGLGCGNPIGLAKLKPGESVIDLGSGAGMDCLLAASAVGPDGKVCGIDMTQEMIDKAREAARKAGATNVEFRMGTLEALPLRDGWGDVVISNCVVNLSPDKVWESGRGGLGNDRQTPDLCSALVAPPCLAPSPLLQGKAGVASRRRPAAFAPIPLPSPA